MIFGKEHQRRTHEPPEERPFDDLVFSIESSIKGMRDVGSRRTFGLEMVLDNLVDLLKSPETFTSLADIHSPKNKGVMRKHVLAIVENKRAVKYLRRFLGLARKDKIPLLSNRYYTSDIYPTRYSGVGVMMHRVKTKKALEIFASTPEYMDFVRKQSPDKSTTSQ